MKFILYKLYFVNCNITALSRAVTDLQQTLAQYYKNCFQDDMFTSSDEGHSIKLSDIYAPIKWVENPKTAECVTDKELTEYSDILRKVCDKLLVNAKISIDIFCFSYFQ